MNKSNESCCILRSLASSDTVYNPRREHAASSPELSDGLTRFPSLSPQTLQALVIAAHYASGADAGGPDAGGADADGLGADADGLGADADGLGTDEGPVLVVAPSSVLEQWRGEIRAWWPRILSGAAAAGDPDSGGRSGREAAPLPPPPRVQVVRKGSDVLDASARFVIVSYGLFGGNARNPNNHLRCAPSGAPWRIAIADESHLLKVPCVRAWYEGACARGGGGRLGNSGWREV